MTTLKARIIRKMAQIKAQQSRGASWVNFIISIGSFAAIFKLLFGDYGISSGQVLLVGAAIYIVCTTIIGKIDEKHGIWEQENAYNQSMNPATMKILNHVGNGEGSQFVERNRGKV